VTHQTARVSRSGLPFIGVDVAEVLDPVAERFKDDPIRAAQALLHGLSDGHASAAPSGPIVRVA
jgi:hypothetical protein